jgi:hypothetical protein
VHEILVPAVLEFVNGGALPPELNDTDIILIPKVRHPQSITQYRPISLCNVIYKICTKMIASRLRPELEETISQEQSAFVLGRLITDNAPRTSFSPRFRRKLFVFTKKNVNI